MAHHIDWDNIHLHIHHDDVRYKRRLHRKRLFINCSPADASLKKLKSVKDQNFMGNDELMLACPNVVSNQEPTSTNFGGEINDLEMVKEGFREGGQSLVCIVDDNDFDDVGLNKTEDVQGRKFLCDDEFWVECSNVVRNPEPFRVKCGTRGDDVDFDSNMFNEDLKEEGYLNAASDVGIEKQHVQDHDLGSDELRVNCRYVSDEEFGTKRMFVDPDYKKFLECLKEDGHSFSSKVEKNDGSSEFLKYEKDELHKECQRKSKGDRVKNVLRKQKGDTAKKLRKNKRKEKRDEVVLRGDVNFVSSKEKKNVMHQRDGFPGNSNRYYVTKRNSVVKRGENKEIISIGKPNEIEEVTISKNYRPSKIIKNNGHLNLDDGRNLEYLRKSKKKYEKVERRPCLTRTGHERNLMDTAGKGKRHLAVLSGERADYRRTSSRNNQRELVVQQGEDIENSRFGSDIGNIDVMVKKEKFDDSTNAVLSKKSRQMIQGRDSLNDNNLRPRYTCDTKFVKYAEVKEENANSLIYEEEDNEHSSDLEILDTDNQQNLSKFEVMKVFNASVIEDNPLSMVSPSDYEAPQFREELMNILRRPYSIEEYRVLMEKAKYRHVKGGPEYSDGLKGKKMSNTYGKSPLDYHPEVKRRLRQCRKITKRLNILRGFIYWYGRTCQEGAFKPWLDKSCSAITPSPR